MKGTYLLIELFIFVKIFESYLVTQSILLETIGTPCIVGAC
jgi:hypothetical protein